MEDIITPNISMALYRYLCQHIVGSEDHVKQIRLTNAIRDNFRSNGKVTIITSGSFGEGLSMRGSDLDVMYVSRTIEVYEDIKPFDKSNLIYLSIDRNDVKPGYAQLKLDYCEYRSVLKLCDEQNGEQYFSSTLFKQLHLNNLNLATIHGPCISNPTECLDFACCLHCKTWVSPAGQWITRSNNSWPSHNVKQSIIKHGVLFVPIGVKGSLKEDLEWRVSFSVGEKFLINTFTHTQILCYALLKIILKDVIATFPECEYLLCSYFLKTIVFWISEELPQSVWKPDYLIHCFMRCFSRLIYCVEHSVCLHYFIPENNMFENKIVGRAREILLEKLYVLHSYNWRCILFSDQISKFDLTILNLPIKQRTQYSKDVEKLLSSNLWQITNCALSVPSSFSVNMRMKHTFLCQQFSKFSIRDVSKFYMSKWCQVHAQRVPLISTLSNNKYQYKQYTICLSAVLDNIYHDAVSGWLMVATLFYKKNNTVKLYTSSIILYRNVL